jgi:hypothetical protein
MLNRPAASCLQCQTGRFVFEVPPVNRLATSAVAFGDIAALHHKVFDRPMKFAAFECQLGA